MTTRAYATNPLSHNYIMDVNPSPIHPYAALGGGENGDVHDANKTLGERHKRPFDSQPELTLSRASSFLESAAQRAKTIL